MWERPVSKLSEELGISDVAIGKICRKMHVAKPARGYWARIEAGQRRERPLLPKATAESVMRVDVYPPTVSQLASETIELIHRFEPVVVPSALEDPVPLIADVLVFLRSCELRDSDILQLPGSTISSSVAIAINQRC